MFGQSGPDSGSIFEKFFPYEALGPFIGGLLVWFGLNYLYLAPQVIGPRLSERYYTPACMAAVTHQRAKLAENIRTMRAQIPALVEKYRQKLASDMNERVERQADMMFGGKGKAVLGIWGGYINGLAGAELRNRADAYEAALEKKFEADTQAAQEKQKFSTPAAFCGCNVKQGTSDKVEMALFTASLRFYKPDLVQRLEQGEVFESCGNPPVI